MSNLIAIFGISGIGKTTACKSFISRNSAFGYISASDVLRQASGLSVEQLGGLSKNKILHNQALLAEMLPQAISKTKKKYLLLDGQNVVDNGVEVIELPVTVIELLHPYGIVLLEAEPADVFQRRENDSRTRPIRTAEEIANQMSLVRKVTESYARKLRIPLTIGIATPSFELDESIYKVLRPAS